MKTPTKLILSSIGVGGIALLAGGYLWYTQKEAARVVFENQLAEEVTPETSQVSEIGSPEKIETKEVPEQVVPKEETPSQEVTKEPLPETKSEIGSASKGFSIKPSLVSFGHESANGRKIDTIVLHSSYSPSGDPYSVSAVMGIWKGYGVAPHYMVARDGMVYQLVADKDIAYHAGESEMKDGRKNVNDFSIGVEILNTKDDEYTKAQYQAVKDLIAHLKGKYSIKYVVGHDDIAPGRKTDPWNFNWNKI